jgi:hypothetical protein
MAPPYLGFPHGVPTAFSEEGEAHRHVFDLSLPPLRKHSPNTGATVFTGLDYHSRVAKKEMSG